MSFRRHWKATKDGSLKSMFQQNDSTSRFNFLEIFQKPGMSTNSAKIPYFWPRS